MSWLTGSKRLRAELDAFRQAVDRQEARIAGIEQARLVEAEAAQARLDDVRAALDVSSRAVAELRERLDAVETHINQVHQAGETLAATFVASEMQRAKLEQAIVKLEKLTDAEADEARTTATALLQRLEKLTKTSSAQPVVDQAVAR